MAGGCLRCRRGAPHRGGTRHQEGSQAQRLDRAGQCAPMRIGLLTSNAALVEYFVTALGIADHAVTLYPARRDLVSALTAAASLQGGAPHEVLLLELILDASGRQLLADLSGLAKN